MSNPSWGVSRWSVVATLALALASCDAADRVAGLDAGLASDQALLARAGGPLVESARGSGHINNGTFHSFFSFNALRDASGVKGQFEFHSINGARHHGRVTCLVVDGNRAWIGGVYERSTVEAVVGGAFVVPVTDGGEGANAAPDLVANPLRIDPATAEVACEARQPRAFAPFLQGNIQVSDD